MNYSGAKRRSQKTLLMILGYTETFPGIYQGQHRTRWEAVVVTPQALNGRPAWSRKDGAVGGDHDKKGMKSRGGECMEHGMGSSIGDHHPYGRNPQARTERRRWLAGADPTPKDPVETHPSPRRLYDLHVWSC